MRAQILFLVMVFGKSGAESQGPVKRLLHRYQESRSPPDFRPLHDHLGNPSYHGSSYRLTHTSSPRYFAPKPAVPRNEIAQKLQEARKVIMAGNKFGLNLMRFLISENDNTIMAPVSLSIALGMLYFAAAGNTKAELSRALHYDDFGEDPNNLLTPIRFLNEAAKASKAQGVTVELGNLIFAQKNLNISKDYRALIEETFGGFVEDIDFSQTVQAVTQMNKIITSLTKGQIDNPIESVSPTTRVVLTNAVFFKGFWKKPFSVRSSFDSTFFNDGVSEVPVKMMYMRDSFLVKSLPELDADAIQLPYESDITIMLVLLPRNPNGVNRMLQNLNIAKVIEDLPTYANESVDLHIPRFSVRGSYHLKKQLYDLGIKDLFVRGKADLPQLDTEGQLVVDDVLHEAKIRVDERGTEAVAISTAAIINYSRYPSFNVRHPFVFFVIHKETGSIFFAGKILRMNSQEQAPTSGGKTQGR
ncbi:leukocyte elastase inhibitor [Galendromus occidentalis]|uniref:Leukocyte elastase inhibitor n=1 Tax=Galendromus occidentalis TaxID=34638 RepID=A0AAJ6QYA3_9ACAR|nr:leukocyte elastase inhibitor [Galendromus occidentalis]